MNIERKRLIRLLVASTVAAVMIAAGFAWITQPMDSSSQFAPPVTTTSTADSSNRPPVVFPDHGEPRTVRLAHLEHAVKWFGNDPASPVGEYAHALLSLAEVRIQLGRFAGAQEAVETVRQLNNVDSDSWYRNEAELLQQNLLAWETADDAEQRLRQDCIHHHTQALQLYASGEYLDAINASRHAVSVQRQLIASSSTSSNSEKARLADELLLLGRLSLEHSDTYLHAEGILSEAGKLCVSVRGPKHPAYAAFLTALAKVDDDRGHFDIANPLYEEALEVLRSTRGEQNLDFARMMAMQGRMHLDWWEDYAAGKGYRALQIRQQLLGDDHLECAESFEHLGMNALWLLNFDKAKDLLERAYAIRKRDQGHEHPDTAESRNWLSQVYIAKGDIAQASLTLQQAIQTTVNHRGRSHPRIVSLMGNLAHLGQHDWNQPRGEREGRRALEIATSMGTSQHPSTFDTMIAVASLMLEEESPYGVAQARRINPAFIGGFLKEVIAAHDACPRSQQLPTYAAARIHMAHVGYWDDYISMSREDAEAYLKQALENLRKHDYDLHPAYPEYLTVLGRWHLWNGEENRGKECLELAKNTIEQRYGRVQSENPAGAWRALAGAYMHAGIASPEMDQCLRRTAELDEKIFRHNAAGQCDVDRYCISRARFFSLGVCVLNPNVTLATAERYRQIVSTKGETSELHANERRLYERQELKTVLDNVRQVRRRLKSIAYDVPKDPNAQAEWRERLFAASDEKESQERELAILARPFMPAPNDIDSAAVQDKLPTDTVLLDFVQYTQLGVPPGGRGRLARSQNMGVFVVSHDQPIQFVWLGTSDRIDKAIAKWLESMRSGEDNKMSQVGEAQEVRRLVWEPLKSAIGESRKILIAPDGPICFVPFAALPGETPGSYLIEDITFGYVPSARQWLDLLDRDERPEVEGLLAVGDVNYGSNLVAHNERVTLGLRAFNPAEAAWENLPATRAEAEQICRLLTSSSQTETGARTEKLKTRIMSGEEPTIKTLQAALSERWRYFHFAGHGLFADLQTDWGNKELNSFQPRETEMMVSDEAIVFGRAPQLLSGLVLTLPKNSSHPSDAILTAEDVAGLDLRGTEMVVLSACETALGNTIGGEGVLGLQRAFLNAGARSTVTSLWKVNDAATSILMERFYTRLWQDRLPKWEALRQAQVDLLREPKLLHDRETLLVSRGLLTGKTTSTNSKPAEPESPGNRSHPSLWAAFVLYGDGR